MTETLKAPNYSPPPNYDIAREAHTMTPARLRDCLTILHWTQRDLARVLDVEKTNVSRWASGRLPVPDNVGIWLDYLAQAHEGIPVPDVKTGRWRKEKACITRQLGA